MSRKSHDQHRNALVFLCRERIHNGISTENTEERIAGTNSQLLGPEGVRDASARVADGYTIAQR